MERYLRWFARLGRFYQIVLTAAVLVGLLAIAASALADSPLFLLVGVAWLVGGSAVVWIADRRERS
jgi:hypothetical protein